MRGQKMTIKPRNPGFFRLLGIVGALYLFCGPTVSWAIEEQFFGEAAPTIGGSGTAGHDLGTGYGFGWDLGDWVLPDLKLRGGVQWILFPGVGTNSNNALEAIPVTFGMEYIPPGLGSSSTLFALGCFALPGHPSLIRVLLAQGLIGVSTAVMIPVLSAMAMGLAGKERFPHVMGLAQGANHTGSVAGALIVGFLAHHWNPDAVFLFYGISAFLGGLMALLIPRGSIDPLLSREARPDGHILSMGTLLKAPVLLFFLTIFLFFVANTAMLPLAGEKLANRLPEPPGEVIAWAIVVTQAIMTALSLLTPFLLRLVGSRPIFLLCLLLLPARGFFLSVAQTQREILEIQILDGIATGILSVLLPVLVSDIARGSGRFNAMIGLMGAMISAGGFLSQILAGHLAEFAGIDRTFLVLSAIAAIAFILGAAGAGRARIAPPPILRWSPLQHRKSEPSREPSKNESERNRNIEERLSVGLGNKPVKGVHDQGRLYLEKEGQPSGNRKISAQTDFHDRVDGRKGLVGLDGGKDPGIQNPISVETGRR